MAHFRRIRELEGATFEMASLRGAHLLEADLSGVSMRGVAQPFHPIGEPFAGYAVDGFDTTIFTTEPPAYSEVLRERVERMGMVGDFVAGVTSQTSRRCAATPGVPSTGRACARACT
jgi:uncharacterized protein YjbI with pentapeptide repeats